MDITLSKQLARFAAELSYDAIPPNVIDKAKACTLQNITSALIGAQTPRGRTTMRIIKLEEPQAGGATILVDGSRVTRTGAAFVNSDLMCITNQCDSYEMLTHPGCILIPAALATAEIEEKGGREFIEAVVAGYEVHNRIADGFIPSTQARGFRSASVYGIFGAAVATAKLLGFDEDKMACTIALAAAAASGNLESARTGGEYRMHEPNAARTGALAAIMAGETRYYADTVLEGEAGFYYAFTGSNQGKLPYVYTGPNNIELSSVVDNLGTQYKMLDVTFKPYPTPGYNNPVIELMTRLKNQYHITHDQIRDILVEVNWLEITYPSPAYPRKYLTEPNIGTIHYVTAYVCVEGSYPTHGRWFERAGQGGPGETGQPPQVLELMKRVKVVGGKDRDFFSPRITITMKNETSYTGEFTGDEFKWDFEEDARRVIDSLPGIPLARPKFDGLVDRVRHLETLSSMRELTELCCVSTAA
ncbi:MmgE/PrpD family protein, partial [Chloroflexota bacterium]